ncbi:MAG: cytochrome c, partial [Chloroflexi bacterium]
TRGELRKKILEGVATIGKEDKNGPTPPFRMPGWHGRISREDLDAIVDYLFSLMPEGEEEDW